MEKEKKQKLIHISLWALLAVAVVFVVVTSCVVKYRKDKLADLNSKNQEIESKLPPEEE